jgi:stringent starvation protein B
MSETSTKPYLIRAIYEWCTDNGYTPYIAAIADGKARVPREFVKNGEIVLNISFGATSGLKMDNDVIHFNARFGGVSREIVVPIENVAAIYASENGQGMAFELPTLPVVEEIPRDDTVAHAPTLSSVPTSVDEVADTTPDGDGSPDPAPPKKSGKPFLTRIK